MDIWSTASHPPERPRRYAQLAFFAAWIAVNVASGFGWLGPTNAQVSAKFGVPITPAGWAFSIWGAVFALEGWGSVWQVFDGGYDADGFKVGGMGVGGGSGGVWVGGGWGGGEVYVCVGAWVWVCGWGG